MPTLVDIVRGGEILTPAAKLVLLVIVSHDGENLRQEQIAREAGVTVRTLRRALSQLRDGGYLGTNKENLSVATSASAAETPPPTTGSSIIDKKEADILSSNRTFCPPEADILSGEADNLSSKSGHFVRSGGDNIYIYNNKYIERLKEKDKEEEDNKKKIGLSPSSFPETTPLDVGGNSDIEDTDARTALDCWNSSGHLAEWHYCEAWEAEYRRMREVFPEQALLLEAISRFSDYQQGRKGRDGGYGDNTRHFVGSYKVWSSDEALVKTFRSHQRRFWGEKTKGKKYRPYQDPRRETAPEPELEPVPASELIPLAEAEKDESHRTRCLAFLRGPEANDPQAREEFDRQTCVTIRREECDAGGDWEERACERIEQHLMLDQRRAKRAQIEAPLMGMTN